MFLTKVNLLYFLYLMAEVMSSASDKAKLFVENFSKNSDFDDSSISLSAFHFRTSLKMHGLL